MTQSEAANFAARMQDKYFDHIRTGGATVVESYGSYYVDIHFMDETAPRRVDNEREVALTAGRQARASRI